MTQSIDTEIFAFLARPENLRLTFEIASYATEVRVKLLANFWKVLEQEIRATKPPERPDDEFSFIPFDRMDLKYAAIRVLPKAVTRQKSNLAFTIEHLSDTSAHSIYLGLRWNSEIQPRDALYESAPVKKLMQRLLSDGHQTWGPWWMCAKDVIYYETPDEFLCTFTEDSHSILSQITTAFWSLVNDTETEVAEINKVVAPN